MRVVGMGTRAAVCRRNRGIAEAGGRVWGVGTRVRCVFTYYLILLTYLLTYTAARAHRPASLCACVRACVCTCAALRRAEDSANM